MSRIKHVYADLINMSEQTGFQVIAYRLELYTSAL